MYQLIRRRLLAIPAILLALMLALILAALASQPVRAAESVPEKAFKTSSKVMPGRYQSLQLAGPPTPQVRRTLREAGVHLLQALGGNRWRVRLSADIAIVERALQAADAQLLAGASPSEKIDPHLALPDNRTVPVLVKLHPSASLEAAIRAIRDAGATVGASSAALLRLVANANAAQAVEIAALPMVRYIETADVKSEAESGRVRGFVNAENVQLAGLSGAGVIVGVLEGGHPNSLHADFGSRVSRGDADALNNDPPDVNFHANMTVGLIAGNGQVSSGLFRGLAPGAQVRSYSYTNGDSILNYLGDVADAVANDGVDIMNNSWGDACASHPYGAYSGRSPFLDGVVRGSEGRPVSIFFSAGNERFDVDEGCISDTAPPFANYTTVNHPKAAKNLVTVGGVDSANDRMSDYSSWGPTLDGRLKPEVVGAAQHNGTAQAGISLLDNAFGDPNEAANQQAYRTPFHEFISTNPPLTHPWYGWYSQTSAASAGAAGTAALALEAWRTTFPTRPDLLPSTMKALFVQSARDLSDATTWYNPGPDFASGYGVYDAGEIIASIEAGEPFENQVADGAQVTRYLAVPSGAANLKVTLAWDDPPAAENATSTLINDLDLIVTAPDGTRHFPWTLDPANPANPAVQTVADDVNNLEQVRVSSPQAGTWSVAVAGSDVQDGPQAFSVVANNGPIRGPLDLVLVLDTSGSMDDFPPGTTSLTKIALLRQSVELFVNIWRMHAIDGDRIGVVYFNSDTNTVGSSGVLQPFASHADPLILDVNGTSGGGCTAMGAGLQVAFDSFDAASVNKKAIILFSDGMQSANPFVGRSGSALFVQEYASGDTLPFNAYFCTTSTPDDPDGNPVAPDGMSLAEHGVEIHTVGTGISGASFATLLEEVAEENAGVHHFTDAPDTNLDLFFTNELVRGLKTNTLEIIETGAGPLAQGAGTTLQFPVNHTADHLTLAVSWQGSSQNESVKVLAIGPGGLSPSPDAAIHTKHHSVFRFDRATLGAGLTGEWNVRLTNNTTNSLMYQDSVLAEESCFRADVRTSAGAAGTPLRVEAYLSAFGRPLTTASNVTASIASPVYNAQQLLADWLPKYGKPQKPYIQMNWWERFVRWWRGLWSGWRAQISPWSASYDKALATVQANPEFVALLHARNHHRLTMLDNGDLANGDWIAGDGIYTALLTDTSVAGAYQVNWGIDSETPCGDVVRSELATVHVTPGKIDAGKTAVTVSDVSRGYLVNVTLRDGAGNPVGPGLAHTLQVEMQGGRSVGALVDGFDGSYRQGIAPTGDKPGNIVVRWKGELVEL